MQVRPFSSPHVFLNKNNNSNGNIIIINNNNNNHIFGRNNHQIEAKSAKLGEKLYHWGKYLAKCSSFLMMIAIDMCRPLNVKQMEYSIQQWISLFSRPNLSHSK